MPAIIKGVSSALGYRLGLWRLSFTAHRLLTGKPLLMVFTFHRVVDRGKTRNYYMFYEKGLDYRAFAIHLEVIKCYFDLLSLSEFVEIAVGKSKLRRHSALLTFDDGDSDFVKYALPALREHKCPAVMFVPTGFIGTQARLWHVRVSSIVRRLNTEYWRAIQGQSALLPENVRRLIQAEFPADEDRKGILSRSLNNRFDGMNFKEALSIIENWEGIVGEADLADIKCMGWDDLRLLVENGIDIGSHSVSHGKLAQLEPLEIQAELKDSRDSIARHTGKTPLAVSYPAGSYNDEVVRIAAETGYVVGFTTATGAVRYPAKGHDLLRLPRFDFYGDDKKQAHYLLGTIAVKSILGKRL